VSIAQSDLLKGCIVYVCSCAGAHCAASHTRMSVQGKDSCIIYAHNQELSCVDLQARGRCIMAKAMPAVHLHLPWTM